MVNSFPKAYSHNSAYTEPVGTESLDRFAGRATARLFTLIGAEHSPSDWGVQIETHAKNLRISYAEVKSFTAPLNISLDREDLEYLASIADISASMRPFEELATEAKGCPDPDFYADEDEWDL